MIDRLQWIKCKLQQDPHTHPESVAPLGFQASMETMENEHFDQDNRI